MSGYLIISPKFHLNIFPITRLESPLCEPAWWGLPGETEEDRCYVSLGCARADGRSAPAASHPPLNRAATLCAPSNTSRDFNDRLIMLQLKTTLQVKPIA